MEYASLRGAATIAFLGFEGGRASEIADECVVVPSTDYGVIEDVHLVLNHVLTGYFRQRLEGELLSS